MSGKNGIIWTRFPVRTSPVIFYIDKPGFCPYRPVPPVGNMASSTYCREVLVVGNNTECLLYLCGVKC